MDNVALNSNSIQLDNNIALTTQDLKQNLSSSAMDIVAMLMDALSGRKGPEFTEFGEDLIDMMAEAFGVDTDSLPPEIQQTMNELKETFAEIDETLTSMMTGAEAAAEALASDQSAIAADEAAIQASNFDALATAGVSKEDALARVEELAMAGDAEGAQEMLDYAMSGKAPEGSASSAEMDALTQALMSALLSGEGDSNAVTQALGQALAGEGAGSEDAVADLFQTLSSALALSGAPNTEAWQEIANLPASPVGPLDGGAAAASGGGGAGGSEGATMADVEQGIAETAATTMPTGDGVEGEEEGGTAGEARGGFNGQVRSFISAIAKAAAPFLNQLASELENADTSAMSPGALVGFQAAAQEFNMFMSAFNTSIKTLGQAMNTLAGRN